MRNRSGLQPMAWVLFSAITFTSCAVSRNYDPEKMYPGEKLKSDFALLREILEAKHPSLYWYTPKDSMDDVFDEGFRSLSDSMTEAEFAWRVVAPVLSKIRCGHTSMMMSREWREYMNGRKVPSFPLFVKVWNDSMMVVANMNRDSSVLPGEFIRFIDGISNATIVDSLLRFMVTDGYSQNLNYIRLSVSFPYYYGNVFGVQPRFHLTVSDTLGKERTETIKLWQPPDSTGQKPVAQKKVRRKERFEWIRSMSIDSNVAVMNVNSFSKGSLKSFFKKRFRELKRAHVEHLIIDLRINGGGDMNKAVNLARYISNEPFRIADSAFSISKNFNPYSRYIRGSFWNNLALIVATKKRKDGRYHFGYWERKTFAPKKKYHFEGDVYILTNGLTFSAASLFCSIIKDQKDVYIVGEETGGGWYGNSGIFIPAITLPNTRLRVSLPFFRLVQSRHEESIKGSGVVPDWYIGPAWRDVLNRRDTKMEAVLERIRHHESSRHD